ncbi:MAG: glycoside hydrolase family 127 protein [Kiritimatiellae bacterium]|nr:glycoside hydrolase family 127 protein [Kiritimatiellia bacterium]
MKQHTDTFFPLPTGAVAMRGGLERVIRSSIDGWILGAVPYHDFSRIFREGRPKYATGEMWGKFVRSGCMMYRAFPEPAIRDRMREAVAEILAAERPNGSISCSAPEAQPDGPGGDLWERKYVMLGLLEYYAQIDRDPVVLASLRRQADAILAQVGPAPKTDVRDLGWSPNHVESSTLLEPFMRIHALTGEPRYLEFARYLVECGGAKGSDLVQMAFDNVPPHLMGGVYPKAYETTSYFEGLADYARATGDGRVRQAVLNYFALVRDRELTIVGNGGADQPFHPRVCGEAWSDTAREQTNPDITRMMETCTGVTWMKFCSHVLRLTGDCTAAEAIETYVYNGLVGAMKPDGTGFSYVNLLDGVKTTNTGWGWEFGGFRVTCCNLNGPMGLAYIPYVAVMRSAEGPVIDLYCGLDARTETPSGAPLALSIDTDYPRDGHVRIAVSPAVPETFTLRLRIPAWSANTAVTVNGSPCCCTLVVPGTYLELRREWRAGDAVTLDFDMRCRRIEGPRGVNRAGDGRVAVAYGPVVLTREERLDPRFDEPADIQSDAGGTIPARRVRPPSGARVAFEIPLRGGGSIPMTDYASAGDWGASRIRTWIPATTQ